MRKAIILILAMVVALSALPVTFACYSGGWGHWDRFWRPRTVVYAYPTDCGIIFTSVNAYDNEETFTEPKEVGETAASIEIGGKTLVVTIDTAYPGYEGIVDFCIKNTGIYPATVNGLETVKDSPFYAQLDFAGDVQLGISLQPGETKCGQLVIHSVPQLEEAQSKTFTFDITIDFDCIPTKCETAYAYYAEDGGTYAHCFLNWYQGEIFNKWGWTNGPLVPGDYTFDIYAGAAQCDLSKGENIGTLTVNYDGSTATVTYDITGSDFTMTETHLYVGSDPWPKKNGVYTVIPGQYPLSNTLNYATTDSYTVTGLTGEIYVVAHAVVCD
ncbi:hypothetical protein ES708_08462 [subsurface metagenome]